MKPQDLPTYDPLADKAAETTATPDMTDEKDAMAAPQADEAPAEPAPAAPSDAPKEDGTAENAAEKTGKDEDKSLPELRKLVQEEDSLTGISLKALMGGDFFGSNWFRKQLLYVLFVAFLCILYITNRYKYQEELINKRTLTARLEDRHKRAVVAESELTYFCRRSHIQSLLNDTTLKMSRDNYYNLNVPPANPQTTDDGGTK